MRSSTGIMRGLSLCGAILHSAILVIEMRAAHLWIRVGRALEFVSSDFLRRNLENEVAGRQTAGISVEQRYGWTTKARRRKTEDRIDAVIRDNHLVEGLRATELR